ncbi:MAG TPA: elongation factor P [Candidatus Omnitrophota bacterium]|nr:elongation factor P [Candidatus Omnitrophota bacterium]
MTSIRAGNAFIYNGKLYKCVEYSHIKWAQQARARVKMKDLRTGAITENTFNVDEKVENVHINYRQMQYLYHDGDIYHFMDQENFDQIEIPRQKLEDVANYLKDGFAVSIAFYEDEPLEVQLPTAVELKVVETSPGFKGDTVSGGKPATLETGLVVNVPFFMNVGDVIKVDTRDGKYLGRA